MKDRIFCIGAFLCLLGLTGCSSYYYSILGSNDGPGARNADGEFIHETDTVYIAYSFNGENAPVSISIYNKSDEPLFVDWEQSALIIDDVATPYLEEGTVIDGDASGISIIPPQSRIVRTPLSLANFPFDKIPKGDYRKSTLPKAGNQVGKIRIIEFTEEDSPVYFRSYLTLFVGDPRKPGHRRMAFEKSFYVQKLIKTSEVSPEELTGRQRTAGDFFYIRKVKGARAGMIVGSIAVGVAVIAVEATLGAPLD